MRSRFTVTIPIPSSIFRWFLNCLIVLGILYTAGAVTLASGATITAMEYFIDTDPGPGNGTTVPIPPDSGLSISIRHPGISSDILSQGSHLFFVRAMDSDGVWGPARQVRFEMPHAGIAIDPVHIDQAEYFVDTDPGEGLGIPIPPPAGELYDTLRESVNLTDIDTSNLTIGRHTLYVRMRSSDGIWGKARPLHNDILLPAPFNVKVTGTKTVTAMEYFFGTNDPGEGHGISLTPPASDGGTFAVRFNQISTDALSSGRHLLNIRAKDSDGFWGPAHQKWFEIVTTSLTITGAEYFINTDPGQGNGTPLHPVDGSFDEGAERVFAEHDTSDLTEGEHRIFVRAKTFKDSNNLWSETFNQPIQIGSPPPPVIMGLSPAEGLIGTEVTISGLYFGSIQSSSTVTFNGVLAPVTSWSDTQIVTTAPRTATAGPVIVTVNGIASNSDKIFTVIVAPSISNLSPTYGFIGDPVTIAGTNFGGTQGTSTVTFNGATATVTSWSDTTVVTTVPAEATTGSVVVKVNGVSSTENPVFTVLQMVSISGDVFGDRNGNGSYDEGEGIQRAVVRLTPSSSCPQGVGNYETTTSVSGHYSLDSIPGCGFTIQSSWQGRTNTIVYISPLDVITFDGETQIHKDLKISKTINIETIMVDFSNDRFDPALTSPLGDQWTTRFAQVSGYHRDNSKGLMDIRFPYFHYIQMAEKDSDFKKNSKEEESKEFVKTVLCQALEDNMIPPVQQEDTLYLIVYSGNNFQAYAVPVINYTCPTGVVSAYTALVGTWDEHNGVLGTWVHEIGHYLGTFNHAYSSGDFHFNLPDLYGVVGDVSEYDLMASGSHIEMGSNPGLMSTFSRWYTGWGDWNEITWAVDHEPLTLSVPEISTSPLGINFYKILGDEGKSLLFEVRSKTDSEGNRDSGLPNDGVVLYRLDEVDNDGDQLIWYWPGHLNKTDTFSLNKVVLDKPGESEHDYLDLGLKVSFDSKDPLLPEAKVSVRSLIPAVDFVQTQKGLVVRSWGGVQGTGIGQVWQPSQWTPDMDLHVYTNDGRHVGWNYPKGIFETGIDGAIISGDLQHGSEWILIPAHETDYRFVVTNRDGQLWAEEEGIDPASLDINQRYEVNTLLIDPETNVFEKSNVTGIPVNIFGDWEQTIEETFPGEFIFTGSVSFTDTSAPTSFINIIPAPSTSGWNSEIQSMSITATDDTYVAMTEYSLNSGATWTRYEQPLVFDQTGTFEIKYRSHDNFGNVEEIKTSLIRIDSTAPGLPEIQDAGIYTTETAGLPVSWEASDPESGIAEFQYLIGTEPGIGDLYNGVSTISGSQLLPVSLPDRQRYYICVVAVNLAGMLSEQSCTNGVTFLDPSFDPDDDGFTNGAEVTARSDPFNPNSVPGETTLRLRPGFNLLSFPAETLYFENIYNLMGEIGGSEIILQMLIFDPERQVFDEAGYDEAGRSYGINHVLPPGKGLPGLIVYAKQDTTVTFTSTYCSTWDLKTGTNLVGTSCTSGMTAFELLNKIGDETVVNSIQRYNPVTGEFETAAYHEGQPAGVDFQIVPGEGYFVYMKQERLGFRP